MIFNKVKELKSKGLKIGITFSTFDLLHAGHIAMLAEVKNHCDYLICGLQTDPTIDRPETKNKPIQSIVERQITLSACRFVDEIVVYQTEKDLEDILLTLPIDLQVEISANSEELKLYIMVETTVLVRPASVSV
jgi:glycerol-3-phosphate cytidylyltransferase